MRLYAEPALMVRVALFPVTLVRRLHSPALQAALGNLRQVREQLDRETESAIDELFRRVPQAARLERRPLLDLKRTLHRFREEAFTFPLPDRLLTLSPIPFRMALEAYCRAERSVDQELQRYEEMVRQELLDLFARPDAAEALHLASPSLYADVAWLASPEPKPGRKLTQVTGALARYLVRGTLKTTPQGLWAGSAAGTWHEGDGASICVKNDGPVSRRVALDERAYVTLNPGTAPSYHRNATAVVTGTEAMWWHRGEGSLAFRRARLGQEALALLAPEADLPSSAADPHVFDSLQEIGLLLRDEPAVTEANPAVQVCLATVADGGPVPTGERLDAYRRLRELAQDTRFPVHVDVGVPWEEIRVSRAVRGALAAAVETYLTLCATFLSPPRAWWELPGRMTERFGPDRALPLTQVATLMPRRSDVSEIQEQRWRRLYWDLAGDSAERGRHLARKVRQILAGTAGSRPTVALDLAALLEGAPPSGWRERPDACEVRFTFCQEPPLIHLESINAHVGRGAWRFHQVLAPEGKAAALLGTLRESVSRDPSRIVAAVDYHQDSSADGTVLPYPAAEYAIEMYRPVRHLPRERVIPVRDLYVTPDPGGGSLRLRYGPTGPEVVPRFYSPLTFYHDPVAQLLYLFGGGTLPGIIPSRFGFELQEEGSHVPRLTVESLVLSLERWTLPLPLSGWSQPTRVTRDLLVAAHGLRERLGLPRWVLASTDAEQEPIPVDLENPLLVHYLSRLAARGRWLVLEELFPAPDAFWLRDAEWSGYAATCWAALRYTAEGVERNGD